MPVAVLEKKLHKIPQEYFDDVSNYFDYILFRANKDSKNAANEKSKKVDAFKKIVGIIPHNIDLDDEKSKKISKSVKEKINLLDSLVGIIPNNIDLDDARTKRILSE